MSKGRILIAEDESLVALDLKNRVEQMGYEVCSVVARGEDAVDQYSEHRPNLVLMDIQLDGILSGTQAAQKIQKIAQIPIIFLTAFSDDQTLNEAQIASPSGYLLKPVDDRSLFINIETALFRHYVEQRRRSEERAARESTLLLLLDALPALVVVLDEQGHIERFGPWGETWSGASASELSGLPFWEWVGGHDALRVKETLSKLTQETKTLSLTCRCPNASGTRVQTAWNVVPLGGGSGFYLCLGIPVVGT
jgi:PAS domain S-box-containing protein